MTRRGERGIRLQAAKLMVRSAHALCVELAADADDDALCRAKNHCLIVLSDLRCAQNSEGPA